MSAIHSAPSGPVRSIVGRNQLSDDAKNSDSSSPAGRVVEYVIPLRVNASRCTRLCTGSLTNVLLLNAGPNSSSRYTIALFADVKWFAAYRSLNRASVREIGYTGAAPGRTGRSTRVCGGATYGFRRR